MSANLAAFLAMLIHAEGTNRVPDPYRCCYSFAHTVQDMRDHPAETGEWRGERMNPEHCKRAGFKSGICKSTAAGAYQFILPTWRALKGKLQLPDFSKDSQDKAAAELIRMQGAIPDIEAGRIAQAIDKCRNQWASLPGANTGQPERSLAALVKVYVANGGVLAK